MLYPFMDMHVPTRTHFKPRTTHADKIVDVDTFRLTLQFPDVGYWQTFLVSATPPILGFSRFHGAKRQNWFRNAHKT
jgi:hypothetical protein